MGQPVESSSVILRKPSAPVLLLLLRQASRRRVRLRLMRSPLRAVKQAPAAAAAVPQTQSTITGASPYRDEPVSEMRRTIARRLTSSIGPVPHFFLTSEIEMDRAVELRHSLNEISSDVKVSINDLIIKVVAVALRQHPQVNASFQDKVVRYYEHSDIGVAVAIEDGLITPIIRSADIKTVGAISREVREMAERARSKAQARGIHGGELFREQLGNVWD
ncbi:MAG: 2-oxo acid dehydrogenase subunit E2 [Pyrinomonadaceae bacterium]